MRRKKVEAVMMQREKVTRKSLTEMGFAEPNDAGIRPRSGERGRQTLYDPKIMPYQAYIMCSQNASSFEELGQLWGVTAGTVSEWVKKYEEFANAIKKGRDDFTVGQAEASLKRRMLGYQYEEVSVKETQFKRKTKEGTIIEPITETTRTIKQVAPDVGAAIFTLCNLAPHRWRQKQPEASLTKKNADGTQATLTGLSLDDLRQLKKDLASTKAIE